MKQVSEKTIERLIIYRRILLSIQTENIYNIFSHQLAKYTGFHSAQVRRDLMETGYSGSPVTGYNIKALLKSIEDFMQMGEMQYIALVGLGHLGRAILDYFQGRRQNLKIEMAFDNDASKVNRVIHGCHCYHTDELENILHRENIRIGIIAVPASDAQEIAGRLVDAGVKGILNYSPNRLQLPTGIYIENIDIINSVEKALYFTKNET